MPASKPDLTTVPRHIAIIMDGNGRWAKERGLPRTEGHRRGAESVRAMTEACRELGVQYLTLYAFSSENWKRPKREVDALMKLLEHYLKREVKEMMKNNIKLQAIGRLHDLPESCQRELHRAIETTANNTELTLILALSYGGREEIVDGVKSLIESIEKGHLDKAMINNEVFSKHLYTRYYPDPDLLIRTSGELRLSNFLLWQLSYTEFYITDKLWPDFRKPELEEAIASYSKRQRRFGSV
ncbi:MAG: isoprenyl transferase [Verrucomicrobiaceae bacterium]